MNIVRRQASPLSAFRPLAGDDQFGRLAETMFEQFFSQLAPEAYGQKEGIVSPRLNVQETDAAFEVEAEMPGVKKEDLRIAIDNRRVNIEAEARRETERKDGQNQIYTEWSASKFARSFTLPADVDDASAQARLENGVLKLTLPKKQPTQPKSITVQ
jgi:HSP20 family protein